MRTNLSFEDIKEYLRRREKDPEKISFPAHHDWKLSMTLALIALLAFFSLGAFLFLEKQREEELVRWGEASAEILSKKKVQDVIFLYDEKEALFEQKKKSRITAPDPSL